MSFVPQGGQLSGQAPAKSTLPVGTPGEASADETLSQHMVHSSFCATDTQTPVLPISPAQVCSGLAPDVKPRARLSFAFCTMPTAPLRGGGGLESTLSLSLLSSRRRRRRLATSASVATTLPPMPKI